MKKLTGLLGLTAILASLFLLSACDTAKAPEVNNNQSAAGSLANDAAVTKTETGTEATSGKTDVFAADQSSTPNPESMKSETQPASDNPQLAPPKSGDKVVTLDTSLGVIKFKLFTAQVPEMTKNFETLAGDGKYNGVPFHRVIKDFMIQTGDFTNKNGTGGYSYKGPGKELNDEIVPELKHLFGTVSMANRGPNTNGSQFFIVTNKDGTPFLDGGYTVFGQVYEGMDVALQIADLQTPGGEAPTKEVLIKTAKVETIK